MKKEAVVVKVLNDKIVTRTVVEGTGKGAQSSYLSMGEPLHSDEVYVTKTPFKVGERVLIEIDNKKRLISIFFIFIMPCIDAVIAYFLINNIYSSESELPGTIGAIVIFILSIIGAYFVNKKITKSITKISKLSNEKIVHKQAVDNIDKG